MKLSDRFKLPSKQDLSMYVPLNGFYGSYQYFDKMLELYNYTCAISKRKLPREKLNVCHIYPKKHPTEFNQFEQHHEGLDVNNMTNLIVASEEYNKGAGNLIPLDPLQMYAASIEARKYAHRYLKHIAKITQKAKKSNAKRAAAPKVKPYPDSVQWKDTAQKKKTHMSHDLCETPYPRSFNTMEINLSLLLIACIDTEEDFNQGFCIDTTEIKLGCGVDPNKKQGDFLDRLDTALKRLKNDPMLVNDEPVYIIERFNRFARGVYIKPSQSLDNHIPYGQERKALESLQRFLGL